MSSKDVISGDSAGHYYNISKEANPLHHQPSSLYPTAAIQLLITVWLYCQ